MTPKNFYIKNTIVANYNDIEGIENIFQKYGEEIAAVIIEPISGNMGVVPATQDFLDKLRALTIKYGAVLIFDEVMTGFRVALGGAQSLYGIKPDLTCFGKIIGGGLPVGAYGGKNDIEKTINANKLVFDKLADTLKNGDLRVKSL